MLRNDIQGYKVSNDGEVSFSVSARTGDLTVTRNLTRNKLYYREMCYIYSLDCFTLCVDAIMY